MSVTTRPHPTPNNLGHFSFQGSNLKFETLLEKKKRNSFVYSLFFPHPKLALILDGNWIIALQKVPRFYLVVNHSCNKEGRRQDLLRINKKPPTLARTPSVSPTPAGISLSQALVILQVREAGLWRSGVSKALQSDRID